MKKQRKSIVVLAMITAFMAAALFLPGLVNAGELEPSAAPGPTMKTLDEIPPTWSQKLPASERFELVLDGEAVLDKETGLVWEQSPDTITRNYWTIACAHCYEREVANRKGWRLPTIEELASLVDNDNSNPALPTGHPFSNVQSGYYWSSTTTAGSTGVAWVVGFHSGIVGFWSLSNGYVWCVRGGHGYDACCY